MAQMSGLIQQWFEQLLKAPSKVLEHAFEVEGVRDAHLGPKMERARVSFLIEGSAAFEVVHMRRPKNSEEEMFLTSAIFGFLDAVLVDDLRPWRNLRITIRDFTVDPIDSSASAFRRAGRDAGRAFLATMSRSPTRSS